MNIAVSDVDEVSTEVIRVLEHMTQDWDMAIDGGITGSTKLMEDLAFESIDVVQFAVSLEQAFDRKGLPFEDLFMKDGDYVDDICVGEVVKFLKRELAR